MARHWLGFASEHREIQAQFVGLNQPSIGGHLVSLLQQDSVARHEQLGIELDEFTVAPEPHLAGEGSLQCRQGALGLVVLPEGKQAVDQHYCPNSPAQLGRARRKCQGSGHPEQQGHEVHQLIDKPQQQGTAALAWEAIGSKPLQPPLGL